MIGTFNILNLVKELNNIKTVVFFTTDKVYKNDDKKKKFSENDALGGDDPYSASKSASEIIINSFYKSYFKQKKIIILRAGNIIGGGDISDFRIIPDIIKAIKQKNSKCEKFKFNKTMAAYNGYHWHYFKNFKKDKQKKGL